jgi:sugar phosphate isomerase/epimerase
MKRRNFLKSTSSAIPVAFFPNIIFGAAKKKAMDRIGLTTVVFRNRFRSTKPKHMKLKNELTLLDIPDFFAERFNIHNVELWTRHFDSKSKPYLNEINKKLNKTKSRIIDLQVDTSRDLSDPDEIKRLEAVLEMKEWVDIGATLNTEFIRISSMKQSYQQAVKSILEITAYAKTKGIKALVENHNDIFSNIDNHLNIKRDIDLSNFGLLADFGNYPKDVNNYEVLLKIAPFTKLISAKTKDFTSEMEHESYDFERCIQLFENSGYKGIYSLEQWGKSNSDYDYEKITDWMISKVKNTIGQ